MVGQAAVSSAAARESSNCCSNGSAKAISASTFATIRFCLARGVAVAAHQNPNPHKKPQSHEGNLLWQRQTFAVFKANSE
jgi:hypothetical protein